MIAARRRARSGGEGEDLVTAARRRSGLESAGYRSNPWLKAVK